MISLPRFEVGAVDHCNMRCRGCNHMSPVLPKGLVSPGELFTDLAFLSPMIHATKLRILGGEPLLHPQIDQVLEAARASGLGDQVEVVTNGKILDRMTSTFWALVDSVDLCVYPGVQVSWPRAYDEKVQLRNVSSFHETFSIVKNEDAELVKKIWDDCGIRNVCFGLVNRHFYKCMRSGYIPRMVGLEPVVDGTAIEGLTEKALVSRIKDPTPLESCRYCPGTSAKSFPHEELARDAWMAPQEKPVQELLKK